MVLCPLSFANSEIAALGQQTMGVMSEFTVLKVTIYSSVNGPMIQKIAPFFGNSNACLWRGNRVEYRMAYQLFLIVATGTTIAYGSDFLFSY